MLRAFAIAAAMTFLSESIPDVVEADPLDSLVGKYAFDWHMKPDKTKCGAIDRKLLAAFKSTDYK